MKIILNGNKDLEGGMIYFAGWFVSLTRHGSGNKVARLPTGNVLSTPVRTGSGIDSYNTISYVTYENEITYS